MTLRLRLFLLLGGLVALLVVAQAVLVRSLATRLDQDVRLVATRVGEEILSSFELRIDPTGSEPAPEGEKRLVVVVPDPAHHAAPGENAERVGGESAPTGSDRPVHWVMKREWTVAGPEPGDFERRVDVRVLPPGTPLPELPAGAARPGGAADRQRIEVIPDAAHDLLFVRGPALERRIPIPRGPVASTVERFRSELALGSLALLALGLVAAAVVAHRATRPLVDLAAAARRVGAGERGVAIGLVRNDEVGAAIGAFDAMSARLAELDRENRRLAEAERLSELGEVARGLAHTLRNPLNALGLAVEELAAGEDPERAAELAEGSRRQIRRIDWALRSFLALASARAVASGPVDASELAREVALEALQDAPGRIRVEVDAPAPAPLAAVGAEVKAILQALVVNACEASPTGGRVVVRVAVEHGMSGGAGVRVEVEDEGAGLPPAVRERLFAPHVTTKAHGSGMGLFLAQRLAAGRYGGAVEIRDRPAGGTLAVVRLGDRIGDRIADRIGDRLGDRIGDRVVERRGGEA